MELHNPKGWFTVIFNFQRTDTFLKLRRMVLIIGVYSAIVCYLELNYFHLTKNSGIRNITTLHTLLGFAISILLAYRTNTAYDRWWEGRKAWGNLLIRSRNFAIIISSFKDSTDRKYFRQMIPYYAHVLSIHLNEKNSQNVFTNEPDFERNNDKHKPNQLVKIFYNRIAEMLRSEKIPAVQFNQIYEEIRALNEVCGVCERIKTSPIPYTYNIFIKKFIYFYVMTMPFGYVLTLGYYTIPVVVFVFYVLTSLEMIAQDIEDPFSSESIDLPIEEIAAIIKKNVEDIL